STALPSAFLRLISNRLIAYGNRPRFVEAILQLPLEIFSRSSSLISNSILATVIITLPERELVLGLLLVARVAESESVPLSSNDVDVVLQGVALLDRKQQLLVELGDFSLELVPFLLYLEAFLFQLRDCLLEKLRVFLVCLRP